MNRDSPCRIAVIDDHPPICLGYVNILANWPLGEVVLTANSGDVYFSKALAFQPIDIALVDLNMPGKNGFEVLQWIRAHQPSTKTIIISFDFSAEDLMRAIDLGACAALRKDLPPDRVRETLEAVLKTGQYFDSAALHQTVLTTQDGNGNARIMENLTRQELHLLEHLCDPDTPSYKIIGDRMGISENTVHTYRKRLFAKFGINSKVGLFKLVTDWKLFDRSKRKA